MVSYYVINRIFNLNLWYASASFTLEFREQFELHWQIFVRFTDYSEGDLIVGAVTLRIHWLFSASTSPTLVLVPSLKLWTRSPESWKSTRPLSGFGVCTVIR